MCPECAFTFRIIRNCMVDLNASKLHTNSRSFTIMHFPIHCTCEANYPPEVFNPHALVMTHDAYSKKREVTLQQNSTRLIFHPRPQT